MMGAPRNRIIAIATTLITLSIPLTATAIPFPENTPQPQQIAGPIKTKPSPAAAPPSSETLDDSELQEIEGLFDGLEQELEDFENAIEADNPGAIARFEAYTTHLATCSPFVGENILFVGHHETIHGWEGDYCRVDKAITFGEFTQRERCLYTRRDLELISNPALYTPHDIGPQCTELKPVVRNNLRELP